MDRDESTGRYAVVMTTCGNREEARKLARGLVDARLAACVQMLDIESVYRWEGTIHEDAEVLLLIKTRRALYSRLEAFLRQHHPYQVPEIVLLPVEAGWPPYLAWVDEETAERRR